MTRGNQRELARAKKAKQEKGKAKDASSHDGNKGTTLTTRKERDADIMRQKQEAAAAKKAAAGASK